MRLHCQYDATWRAMAFHFFSLGFVAAQKVAEASAYKDLPMQ